MSNRVRAALIGAGFMGDVHTRAIQRAGGLLKVVATSTPAKSADAALRYLAERSATPEEAATASVFCSASALAAASAMSR